LQSGVFDVKFANILCGTEYFFTITANNAAGLNSGPSQYARNPATLPSWWGTAGAAFLQFWCQSVEESQMLAGH
jgi:hypothetical protein